MKSFRLFSAFALLTLGACGSPRGGNTFTTDPDGGATADTAVTTDTAASDAPAAPDVPAAPNDVAAPVDVPVAPIDVPVAPIDAPTALCGDGTCNGSETCVSCRADCEATCPPPPPDIPVAQCGDGTCNGSETCVSCRADCEATCPPPPMDVPMAFCGDRTCNGGELCGTCPSDCGACTGSVLDPCPSTTQQGPNRDCGWRAGVTLMCSPGRATMVGCSGTAGVGSLCQPDYGVCTGDPVMRVCPTTTPCTAAAALRPSAGSVDDQCGACPSAYVTCPASGQIFVLTGDFDSNQPTQRGTCTPAAR